MLCLEKSPMVPSHRMTRVEGGRSQIWTFFFALMGSKLSRLVATARLATSASTMVTATPAPKKKPSLLAVRHMTKQSTHECLYEARTVEDKRGIGSLHTDRGIISAALGSSCRLYDAMNSIAASPPPSLLVIFRVM